MFLRLLFLIILHVIVAGGSAAARIVVLADVHGDLAGAREALALAGVIGVDVDKDVNGTRAERAWRWTGGSDTLVQLGDLVDRGPDDSAVLKFFLQLSEEAKRAGGRVVVLMGNHELLQLQGTFSYVHADSMSDPELLVDPQPGDTSAPVGAEQDAREADQARGSDVHVDWELDERTRERERELWADNKRQRDLRAARSRAFGPSSALGAFVRGLPVVHLDAPSRTLFVHAGLEPAMLAALPRRADANAETADLPELEALNRFAREELDAAAHGGRPAAARGRPRARVLSGSGPVWTRAVVKSAMRGDCEPLEQVLAAAGAQRMVVGHTVQKSGRVGFLCDDKLVAADTGLSRWMYGHVSVLEILVAHNGPQPAGGAAAAAGSGERPNSRETERGGDEHAFPAPLRLPSHCALVRSDADDELATAAASPLAPDAADGESEAGDGDRGPRTHGQKSAEQQRQQQQQQEQEHERGRPRCRVLQRVVRPRPPASSAAGAGAGAGAGASAGAVASSSSSSSSAPSSAVWMRELHRLRDPSEDDSTHRRKKKKKKHSKSKKEKRRRKREKELKRRKQTSQAEQDHDEADDDDGREKEEKDEEHANHALKDEL